MPDAPLVERDAALALLLCALARVRDGRGEVALVMGEAGAGKSALVAEMIRVAGGSPLVLRGACDPLSVPRPLGPLIDAVGDVDAALARSLAAGTSRVEAFAQALSLVDGSRAPAGTATVLVLEDMHWADDASLDLLTFLGRRIRSHPTLLVVTYREDEVDRQHPLRLCLGEIGAAIGTRVHLDPLSLEAVAEMAAGSEIDAGELHRMTGGNPFYVTEVLGSGAPTVPESVRDAVAARTARLAPAAQDLLRAASVVPGRIEPWLLEAIAGADAEALDACLARGLLLAGDDGELMFRHELARVAVTDSLAAGRRTDLHRRVALALTSPPAGVMVDSARVAFHAAQAGDGPLVLEHGPVAATAAAAVGAHHAAALHLERAISFTHTSTPATRASLHERLGIEYAMISRPQDALAAFEAAATDYAFAGDVGAAALALIRTGGPYVTLGRQAEGERQLDTVAAMLRGHDSGVASAALAAARTSMHMLARRFDDAEREGLHAMRLAEAANADEILAEACIQSGIALAMAGDDAGLQRVRRGIDLAAQSGNDSLVSLGLGQIGSGFGELRRYDVAVPALREGIARADAREIIGSGNYSRAWLARCELEIGEWDAAGERAAALMRSPSCVGISRFVALLTVAWLRGRRGDPGASALLDEALQLARATQHIQRLWPVAACRAEIAWLDGRLDTELPLVSEVADLAAELAYVPAIEQLNHWLAIARGEPCGDASQVVTAFGLSAAGRHDLAAARWAELGCPYEEASERLLTGNAADQSAAYSIFDRLGATPMRRRAADVLRDAGRPVPRRPAAAAQANPYLLTDRELEVLALLATGRTDKEIAAALRITAKTVGHHVSRVLAKLGVRTRAQAAVLAEREGLGAEE